MGCAAACKLRITMHEAEDQLELRKTRNAIGALMIKARQLTVKGQIWFKQLPRKCLSKCLVPTVWRGRKSGLRLPKALDLSAQLSRNMPLCTMRDSYSALFSWGIKKKERSSF